MRDERLGRVRWGRLRVAAIGLALAAVATAASALEDPAARARSTVLDNGLTVLTLEDHATPVVSFQMWVKVGSRDESRHTGLAHLFEHMMFKGSKHVAPEQHAQLVQSRGGALNAYTTRDFTVYFENVTSEHLPLVIELEAERLAHLDISESTLESEREVVLEERRMRTEDRPGGRAQEALHALAFQAHPYRWPVIGWRSDVATATVEVCRDFFRTYYVPDNIVIAIVGDFETADALDRVRRAFGALPPSGAVPRNPTEEPQQTGERRATLHFDLRGPLVQVAWHAPPTGHPDAEALDVASQILSGGRSSRLYRRLVYEAEQALYAHAAYAEYLAAGLVYATAGVRPDGSADRVEALLFEEIGRLRDEPASAAELEKARRQLEVSLVNGLGTASALAGRIAYDTAAFGRIRPLEERLAAIRSVGADDVQRVVRKYLIPERRSVVRVVAPPGGAAP